MPIERPPAPPSRVISPHLTISSLSLYRRMHVRGFFTHGQFRYTRPNSKEKFKLSDVETDFNHVQRVNSSIIGEVSETSVHGTERGLKARHTQMIAIGATIGTGLFVGAGEALSIGGPLLLLIAYCNVSVLVYGTVTATTEMSAYLLVRGANMAYFGTRFFSRSLGFAMDWMYWYILSITVPAEITATALVINSGSLRSMSRFGSL